MSYHTNVPIKVSNISYRLKLCKLLETELLRPNFRSLTEPWFFFVGSWSAVSKESPTSWMSQVLQLKTSGPRNNSHDCFSQVQEKDQLDLHATHMDTVTTLFPFKYSSINSTFHSQNFTKDFKCRNSFKGNTVWGGKSNTTFKLLG